MEALKLLFDDSSQVLIAGLVLGAGIPAVFALGVRALAIGSAGTHDHNATEDTTHGSPLGKVLAAICFLIVAYAIISGIMIIVASGLGKDVDFSHVIPMLVSGD